MTEFDREGESLICTVHISARSGWASVYVN